MFKCSWKAQVSISLRKTMAAGRGCSITRTALEHGERNHFAQRTVAIVCVTTSSHITPATSKNDPLPHGSCFAHTMPNMHHDGGGRVLDTQPSAGTLDTNTDPRLSAGTAARAKIKHPRSARAGCDRHTHHREENLRHRRQMLHESASDAFAIQSNPSNCS